MSFYIAIYIINMFYNRWFYFQNWVTFRVSISKSFDDDLSIIY